MNYKEIQELLKMINRSDITEFKIKEGDFSLSIKANRGLDNPVIVQQVQTAQPVQVPIVAPPTISAPVVSAPTEASPKANEAEVKSTDADLITIKSPIVGTFYRSASPDKPPFIKIGDTIKQGQVVCIVEAMKLFNEIESDVSGKVVKIMTEDASPVEYDQVLFLIDPKG